MDFISGGQKEENGDEEPSATKNEYSNVDGERETNNQYLEPVTDDGTDYEEPSNENQDPEKGEGSHSASDRGMPNQVNHLGNTRK